MTLIWLWIIEWAIIDAVSYYFCFLLQVIIEWAIIDAVSYYFFFLLQVTSELLDIASSNSCVDHPLCEECTDTLIQQVEEQLQFTANKARSYSTLLDELKRMPLQSTQNLAQQLFEVCSIRYLLVNGIIPHV